MSKKEERDKDFQFLVLQALWVIILSTCANTRSSALANKFRGGAIDFGDRYGNQSEGAPAYRRETTFGGSV